MGKKLFSSNLVINEKLCLLDVEEGVWGGSKELWSQFYLSPGQHLLKYSSG